MKDQNSLHDFQIKKYSHKIQSFRTDQRRFKIILELAGSNHQILDLGCYYQSLDKNLQKRKNEVVGIDISPQVVKRSLKASIPAFVCNLETDPWPVKKKSFDVVIAGEIIEHLLDTGKFLDNIYQVLKPDGNLILSTPNLASLGRRLQLLLGRNPEIETAFHPQRGGHVRYFVEESLFILLGIHHFTVTEFCSDAIVFTQSQSLYSTKLATLFPTLGKSLIVQARKLPKIK